MSGPICTYRAAPRPRPSRQCPPRVAQVPLEAYTPRFRTCVPREWIRRSFDDGIWWTPYHAYAACLIEAQRSDYMGEPPGQCDQWHPTQPIETASPLNSKCRRWGRGYGWLRRDGDYPLTEEQEQIIENGMGYVYASANMVEPDSPVVRLRDATDVPLRYYHASVTTDGTSSSSMTPAGGFADGSIGARLTTVAQPHARSDETSTPPGGAAAHPHPTLVDSTSPGGATR